jgi:hypothetical protein
MGKFLPIMPSIWAKESLTVFVKDALNFKYLASDSYVVLDFGETIFLAQFKQNIFVMSPVETSGTMQSLQNNRPHFLHRLK